jgi:hypothetical protein
MYEEYKRVEAEKRAYNLDQYKLIEQKRMDELARDKVGIF